MPQARQKESNKPDYTLSVLQRDTEHKGVVGAAWKNADGSISIKLSPFVVLSEVDNLMIRLFVNDPTYKPAVGKTISNGHLIDDDEDGQIPF